MLERLFRKQKPRVFLGAIGVADRTDIKRHLEQDDASDDEPLASALRRALAEIFSLPPADSVESPQSSDLVLDVWIPKYQSGEVLNVYLGTDDVTLLWRPKVTVSARLSSLTSGRMKGTFSVTEKMKWREFLGRIFWGGFSSGLFGRQDLDRLLCQACVTLLTKMQKAL